MTYFNFPQTVKTWYIIIFNFENTPALTLSLETMYVSKSIQFVFPISYSVLMEANTEMD